MLSKKILINGTETYIQSNKNPAGEVSIDWVTASIHRRINLVRINHSFISDVMQYEYLLKQNEIINLNSFDQSDADPDYTLIDTVAISLNSNISEVVIPKASFRAQNPLSPVTAVSLFPLNAIWYLHFKELAQEDIVDFTNGGLRQPFYSEIVKVEEDALNANNGSIAVQNAWGGNPNLEYSIDDGVNWQTNSLFDNLAVGSYLVKIKDGLGNESISKEIELFAFEED